jgi:hypothetical protein
MSRRIIVAMMATALLLTVGLGQASAKKRHVARHTTMTFQEGPQGSPDQISGQVLLGPEPQEPIDGGGEPLAAAAGGGAARCLAGQKVLIRDTIFAAAVKPLTPASARTRTSELTGTVVATTFTDAQGFWHVNSFDARAANQLLFDKIGVEVVKKPLKAKGGIQTVCDGAFASKTVFSY